MSTHRQTPISIVLFDADGVVQSTPAGWLDAWAALIDDPSSATQFLNDIFEAEKPFLTGGPGLAAAVSEVLLRWGSARPVKEALTLWTQISPDPDMLALVDAVRRRGITVGLATNQQPHRYQFMTESLGYGAQFDHLFVSSQMGVAKPSAGFFEHIVEVLGESPRQMLFIDDNADNVSAAAAVGLNAELFHLREGQAAMTELLQRYGLLP